MACNCKNIEGFKKALQDAIAFEKATGKQAAIFKVGTGVSFTDKSNITKISGICCYFTTDSVEHKMTLPKKRRITKKED